MQIFDFVLIIDDDPVNNVICENILLKSRMARKVHSLLKVKEAIAFLEKQMAKNDLPDIILLDLRFPEHEEGVWYFLDQYPQLMAKTPKQTPLFILTSSIAKTDMKDIEHYDFIKGFLSKPLTEKTLRNIFEIIQ